MISTSSKEMIEKASSNSASLDIVNIFYYASAGNKIFLGTVDDGIKLAHFSLIARDQLSPVEGRSSKTSIKGSNREVTIGRVDREAAQLVLKYINNNAIHHPEPIKYDLLPSDSTFALRCKVHHACNVFRIPRQLCGDDLRDRLCFEIRQLPTVTCADFQLVCETAYFDAGLMNVMQNKVAYHTLRARITEHELACIWEFVSNHDAVKGSNYIERINAIFEKLQADATARGKVFNSGWCAEGVTPGQPRGSGQSVVMPTRPKTTTVGAAGKAAAISIEPAVQGQGAPGRSAQVNQLEDEETVFVRPSVAGLPPDLSTALKTTSTKSAGNAPTVSTSNSKTILKPGNPTTSADAELITETTSPKKTYANVGGVVCAIKPAAASRKGKGKLEVAVPETKEQAEDKGAKETEHGKSDEGQSEKEHGDGKAETKGKGKENLTPPETTPSAGSPSTPGKMSYAQMLGRDS